MPIKRRRTSRLSFNKSFTGSRRNAGNAKFVARFNRYAAMVNRRASKYGKGSPFRKITKRAIVTHREFIGDVTASGDFQITTFALNPGISATFPWLSRLAQCYQEYNFYKLAFQVVSTSSDAVLSNAASPALGTVIGATQYNPAEKNFESKAQMQQYLGARSKKPSITQRFHVRVKDGTNVLDRLFIRSTPPPQGADIKFFDTGKFTIGVQGVQNAEPPVGENPGVIGELWVEYTVCLMKPSTRNISVMTENWFLTNFQSAGTPFGQTQTLNPNHGEIGLEWFDGGDGIADGFYFPEDTPPNKRFLVNISYSATAGKATWATADHNPVWILVNGGKIHPIREPGIPVIATQNPVAFAPSSDTDASGAFQMSFIVEILPTYNAPRTKVEWSSGSLTITGVEANLISGTMWVTEVNDID